MTTNTELVNAALRKGGGAKRILDLTDSVGSAGIAADVLTTELEDLLRSGVWNFAVTRAKLAQLSTVPVFEWQFAYGLPSDCDRVVSVHDNSVGRGEIPYKLEALQQADKSYINVICSNANTVYLRYCRTVTDPNLMTASFRQVLILRLAKIFAVAIAKSNSLFQALDAEEKVMFQRAKSIDGIEDWPERFPEGSWATSRRRSGRSSGFFPDDGFCSGGAPTPIPQPSLILSSATVPDDAVVGTTVGTFTVLDGLGIYTYSLSSPFFSTLGSGLKVARPLIAGSYSITVTASNGTGSVVTGTFLIAVIGTGILNGLLGLDGAFLLGADGAVLLPPT